MSFQDSYDTTGISQLHIQWNRMVLDFCHLSTWFLSFSFPLPTHPVQNMTNWADIKFCHLWTVKSVITWCYTRLAAIRWWSKAWCSAVRKCLASSSLGQSLAWRVSVRGRGKFLSRVVKKKKHICRPEFRGIRKRTGKRMPVMGVLGGGGGRLQRSSSVGRGDEGRALTPSQPPRRAHSFRWWRNSCFLLYLV